MLLKIKEVTSETFLVATSSKKKPHKKKQKVLEAAGGRWSAEKYAYQFETMLLPKVTDIISGINETKFMWDLFEVIDLPVYGTAYYENRLCYVNSDIVVRVGPELCQYPDLTSHPGQADLLYRAKIPLVDKIWFCHIDFEDQRVIQRLKDTDKMNGIELFDPCLPYDLPTVWEYLMRRETLAVKKILKKAYKFKYKLHHRRY